MTVPSLLPVCDGGDFTLEPTAASLVAGSERIGAAELARGVRLLGRWVHYATQV